MALCKPCVSACAALGLRGKPVRCARGNAWAAVGVLWARTDNGTHRGALRCEAALRLRAARGCGVSWLRHLSRPNLWRTPSSIFLPPLSSTPPTPGAPRTFVFKSKVSSKQSFT